MNEATDHFLQVKPTSGLLANIVLAYSVLADSALSNTVLVARSVLANVVLATSVLADSILVDSILAGIVLADNEDSVLANCLMTTLVVHHKNQVTHFKMDKQTPTSCVFQHNLLASL